MIRVTIDGDFVCDKKCEEAYVKERDRFFNSIVNDDNKFDRWMRGVE